MAARPRKKRGLCPNLYESNGLFRYRHPVNKTWHALGRDKQEAVRAARELNSILIPSTQQLINSILAIGEKTIADIIDAFKADIVPNKELMPRSAQELEYRLNRLESDLGDMSIRSLSVEQVASYLDLSFKGDAYKQHRSVLSQLCQFAIVKGWLVENPVAPTLSTRQSQRIRKQRQRITWEAYQAIYQHAEEWLQIAMDLAIITLQRRSDLLRLKFSDIKDGRLYLVQSKTEKHGDCARLAIGLGPSLKKVIKRARCTGINSPLLIHKQPQRILTGQGHWSAVKPDYLSRSFSKARDASGIYENISKEILPTFHELRSLGGLLYEQQGWSKAQVRQLMGHTSDKMTEHYLKGHDTRWTQVDADLILKDQA
ncbi:integrase [Zooshikella ganghwensis]|uniref:Integrase n=2 Tax=Zooshikella ganghwensis TaxID=202772 RepID=A0A4P9VMR4_9GAMM|nr:integrase [Zooshikella ganghwensis]